ncbi:MAG: hydantoinase/oxoprolinase family protein [Pseudomonadales bacterium]|nr:hydantoinase/oxoprolinase family protein [Pseudomonadales bacterium]
MSNSKILLGVDAGGTFTDFVCLVLQDETNAIEVTLHKTLSTPDAPERAILQGIADLGLNDNLKDGGLQVVHGSTVATNAALEGNTARTAFVTNYGFGDLLMLGRQTRPALYALEFPPISPPVAPELCLETGGRLSAEGTVLEPLEAEELTILLQKLEELKPQAVAVTLLFSFLDDQYEREIESAIRETKLTAHVSRSSAVLPVYKEYERGIATWLNAALGPVVQGYLSRLQSQLANCPLQIMQSSGETIAAEKAADAAVHLLLSGPAGGLTAIKYLGEQIGENKLISFDMGGTSTDVALLEGEIGITTEGRIGRYPMAVPAVDMHTIGAGGGSIAFEDSGGMLQVGPRSAGASPGPACYGQGGEQATVTDANVVLGRLVADVNLADSLQLDADKARTVVGKLADRIGLSVEDTALGIVDIANEHMAKAIREISVNRGHDPKEFVLTSFGGAGGLHVCALAEAMQMHRAIVPARGGVLSALGMLVATPGRQFTRTVGVNSSEITAAELQPVFMELEQQGRDELAAEGLAAADLKAERSVDMRYAGQSYTLNVPWTDVAAAKTAFSTLHNKRYGYALSAEVEIVNLCVHISEAQHHIEFPSAVTSGERCNNLRQTKVYACAESAKLADRAELQVGVKFSGPMVITEYSATTYVAPGWDVSLDKWGNLILKRNNEEVG